MKFFNEELDKINSYNKLTISGLGNGEKAFLPYFFDMKTVIVCADKIMFETYLTTLQSFNKKVVVLDEKLPLLITLSERSSSAFKNYYKFLSLLTQNDYDVVLISPEVLFQKLPSKEYMLSHLEFIETGKEYKLENLLSRFVSMGYEKTEVVSGIGEFSVRGDTLDIFPINEELPVRISFFDDEVESISYFDLATYKLNKTTKQIKIFCNTFLDIDKSQKEVVKDEIKKDLLKLNLKKSESMLRISEIVSTQFDYLDNNLTCVSSIFFLPYTNYFNASIFDYLESDTKIIFDEPKLITDKITEIDEGNINSFLSLSLSGEFLPRHMDFYFKKLDTLTKSRNFKQIAYSRLVSQNKIFESEYVLNFLCPHVKRYNEHFIDLANDLKEYNSANLTILLSAKNKEYIKRLSSFLTERGLEVKTIKGLEELNSGINLYENGFLHSGCFELQKLIFIGENELGSYVEVKRQKRDEEKPSYLPKVGDYVVHEVHGIGKCVSIKNMKIGSCSHDYIIIEYRDKDLLYVPSENANMLSKFTGEKEPKCNKIGGAEFYKVKQKVKNSIKQMTFDLIKVYAGRMNARGFRYSKDSYLQKEFEDAFEYPYTVDQINAIKDIKKDMESNRIMDRLLCGDVGFGKTEVALVSAFKAIQDGKQVAIICPTTILSEQHYATSLSRMKNFFVNVACLNRFKTKKEQDVILKDLEAGKINLICGTHRLLSKDVKFHDLGLIIIDEEQRFGVEDKDKLKNIKSNVDVLSLSATPIPRTLYMSLVGIRDVSFLSTPPSIRKQVKTSVIDYSDSLLYEVCKREIDRGGQVLIVYNRVQSILNFYNFVKKLLPFAAIDYAHGQMNSQKLEDAIYRLYSRQTQILISTILIENGIDLPFANTLFVIDADKLGLSQLYQLRGRIGRSNIDAYAYFSFSKDKILTMDSYKRLDAIMQFSEFGSGYKVAMRDLEIRGAGDILGREQHGHMEQVGYDLYVKLLEEAVSEIKGEKVEVQKEIKLSIDISAYVPENYIKESENRIEFYTKVSKLSSLKDLETLIENTKNIYGEPPKPVKNLCYVGLIKNLGQKIMAKSIILNDFNTKIVLYEDVYNSNLFNFFNKGGTDFVLNKEKLPIIILRKEIDKDLSLMGLIKFLIKCVETANK